MSEAELIFTALAELSTRQIAESMNATGMVENADAGKKAKKLRRKLAWNWKQQQAKALLPPRTIFPRQRNKSR
jgi:DNA-damage-inducible protein D